LFSFFNLKIFEILTLSFWYGFSLIMPPQAMMLSDVCLSVTYIGTKSKTERA